METIYSFSEAQLIEAFKLWTEDFAIKTKGKGIKINNVDQVAKNQAMMLIGYLQKLPNQNN